MKKLIIALSLIVSVLLPAHARSGREEAVVPAPVLEDIARSYVPWTSAEFNGKLKYDRLPLSPTVRMYMERDSLLQISVRAPLVGEVGRLELTPTQITVVNKLKRTYCREDASRLLDIYPGLIGEVQSLFLARVVVLGAGQLAPENIARVEIEEDREGGWMLIPVNTGSIADIRYGYIVGSNSRTKALAASVPGKGTLEVRYDYRNRGEQMTIKFDSGRKKPFEAALDFTSVKWGGSRMAPVKLDNYERLSVRDFLRSLDK